MTKRYSIRFTSEAELDLVHIYRYIRARSASYVIARGFIGRIRASLDEFGTFPERGTVREHVRPGLRIVGFERRVSVAFVVEGQSVVILRVLYAGQLMESDRE